MKRTLNAGGQRESQWRARIAEQARSGQSVAAWCQEQGIATPTFYWWKSRLAKRPSKSVPLVPQVDRAPFIDLGTLPEPMAAAGLDIRLDLGNGIILTITRR